jgi:hypothetical protein
MTPMMVDAAYKKGDANRVSDTTTATTQHQMSHSEICLTNQTRLGHVCAPTNGSNIIARDAITTAIVHICITNRRRVSVQSPIIIMNNQR